MADGLPVDLPPSLAAQMMQDSLQGHRLMMQESAGNIQSANNIVRHTAAKNFDEVGAIESASTEKVLMQPAKTA